MTTRIEWLLAGAAVIGVWMTAPSQAQTLSDPTRPNRGSASPVSVTPVFRGPVLQATRVSAQNKLAIISGRAVTVGDAVDGAVVADIRPYEVVLRRGGRETTLRLLPKLTVNKKR
jgi:hypothetical protein